MPLRNDILNPIAGDNPAGESLRYAPVFDKIKEARREDDDAPQGDWARERKTADWAQVLKLAGEAIATKSKDLQLAAWLTEALLRREGIAGLKEGLELIRNLLDQYWDGLYPELEEGDAEMRATPLDWVGSRLEKPIKSIPVTRNGLNWFHYRESRTVGYEADANTDEKLQARQAAIDEGKISAETFDAAMDGSPKSYYVTLVETFDATLESLDALTTLCDEKFGDVSPSFGPLKATVEEVRHLAYMLLQKKREKEPDEPQVVVDATGAEEGTAEEQMLAEASRVYGSTAAAPARARAAAPLAAEPGSREDAEARVAAVARYLRAQDAYSPAPYLMLRGLRWGELRAGGETPDSSLLTAPPTQVRQELRRLAGEGQWAEVLEAAETAMAAPYGRAWLDLQRYVARACYELSYENIGKAVRSELRALLADIPTLGELTLEDDTPTANAETLAWIKSEVQPPGQARAAESYAPPPGMEQEQPAPGEIVPDAFDLARQAVQMGRPEQAIEILAAEIGHERSSRARFQRKVQLAQLCLAGGHEAVAYPILLDLAAEIERRGLGDWEAAEVVAHPLVLLYRCMGRIDGHSEEERRKLYARICCLDPVQALSCGQ